MQDCIGSPCCEQQPHGQCRTHQAMGYTDLRATRMACVAWRGAPLACCLADGVLT